jgi:DNA-binding GntR family transcriptional regulator
VIRGGRVEGGAYLATEHAAIVDGFEAGDLEAAQDAIRAHVASGERIALEAIRRAGGAL